MKFHETENPDGTITDLREVRKRANDEMANLEIEMSRLKTKHSGSIHWDTRSVKSICAELEDAMKLVINRHVSYSEEIEWLIEGYARHLDEGELDFYNRSLSALKAEIVTLSWFRSCNATLSQQEVRDQSDMSSDQIKHELIGYDDIVARKFKSLELYRTALYSIEDQARASSMMNEKMRSN